MMVEPGITKLDKCVDSRYTLVAMAAKRARMLGKAAHEGELDIRGKKPVTMAVNEIADGRIGYVRSDEIRKAQLWEEEKFAAILQLGENEEVPAYSTFDVAIDADTGIAADFELEKMAEAREAAQAQEKEAEGTAE